MGNVVFTDLEQFIDELRAWQGLVERKLVRIALFQQEGLWPSIIRRDHLVVTARIGGDIVRLDVYYSPLARLLQNEPPGQLIDQIERDVNQLNNVCLKLSLRVGGGILREASSR